MRVVALNPPFLKKFSRASRSPAVTKSGTIYYPTWLAYATGAIEKAGHEAMLIDAPARGLSAESAVELCKEFAPTLILSDSATGSFHSDVKVIERLHQVLPQTYICMVGTHVSALADQILRENPTIDGVCRREYDLTSVELCNALCGSDSLSDVCGLSYRNRNGSIVHNPDREFIQDLDQLPFVTRVFKKHLRIEDYFYAHIQYPMVTIFTSRGCPGRCTWCMYPQVFYGHDFRHRSPESIVGEFEYVQKELPQVKEILIDDDTFTIDVHHTRSTCELMLQRRIYLDWTCEVRTNLDYDTMKVMKRAGCRLLVAGFESGVGKVLKAMKKGLNPGQGTRFANDARRAGLLVHGCFVAGCESETTESLEETLRYAKSLPLDTAQFFPMMLYPGTEAYEWARTQGYLRTEDYSKWLDGEGLHNTLIDRPGLSHHDLIRFCDRARLEFYLRPRYLAYKLMQSIIHPGEFKRNIKSACSLCRYLRRSIC
jgi:anaerobic magnesium-protoporphyrin IX monomethyl ester cyclase